MRTFHVMAVPLAVAALFLVLLTSSSDAQGLLTNGDFANAAETGLPTAWQLQLFHASPRPEIAVVAEGDRRACRFTFGESSDKWCLSFYQPLPELDTEGQLTVTFWLNTETATPPSISVSVSGAAGCNLPCLRQFLSPVSDRQWHQVSVTFPLRGMRGTPSVPEVKDPVLEFVLERTYQQGDRVYVAGVTADQQGPKEPALHFTAPASGVVFTDAPSQSLAGVIRVPRLLNGVRARLHLELPGNPAKVLARQELTLKRPVTPWKVDLKGRAEGRYVVVLQVPAVSVEPPQRHQLVAWRLRPTPATTRVVNGKVQRGGKPVVLCGTYHVADWALGAVNAESRRIGAPETTRQQMLAGLAQRGFDSFIYTSGIPPVDFIEQSNGQGLALIASVSGLGREWGGKPLTAQIAPWRDDPRIFAWYGSDEPSTLSIGRAAEVYRELKDISPNKLVMTSFCWPEALLGQEGENTPADLVLMDIYLINKPDADLTGIGLAVRDAVRYARKYGSLAVGVAPQMFIYGGGPEPTPEQLRTQMYLGLINGAVAFIPYSYIEDYGATPFSTVAGQPQGMSLNPKRQRWFLPDSRIWTALPGIFSEIRSLEKVIVEEGRPLGVTSQETPVHYLAKRVSTGAYVIAANPRAEQQELTLSLPAGTKKLAPLFGTPPAGVAGGKVTLRFAGYEVKVLTLAP